MRHCYVLIMLCVLSIGIFCLWPAGNSFWNESFFRFPVSFMLASQTLEVAPKEPATMRSKNLDGTFVHSPVRSKLQG